MQSLGLARRTEAAVSGSPAKKDISRWKQGDNNDAVSAFQVHGVVISRDKSQWMQPKRDREEGAELD